MTCPSSYPLLAVALVAACTDDPSPARDATVDVGVDAMPDVMPDTTPDAAPPDQSPVDAPSTTPDPADCDPLDEAVCALPWPSNLYLRADTSRPTGYALRFGPTSLPRSRAGVYVDGSSLGFMDGYGVSTPILARFPNLDVSQMADEESIERSTAADATAMLFEVSGNMLRRVPCWVELDSQESDPAEQVLFLRPAVILKEATRYVVAFRNLRTTTGAAIAPSAAFRALREGMAASDARLAPRQTRFNEVFALLEGAGVARSSLTLAWDFNTASSRALHGRMLSMRDDALRRVGPMGPELQVDDVRTFIPMNDGSGRPFDANIGLELNGTIEVPEYTHEVRIPTAAAPVRVMNYDAAGNPVAQGTTRVPFMVRVPHGALNGGAAHGIVLYGHGLLGSRDEARADHLGRLANTYRFIVVAADLAGMSEADVGTVFGVLQDMSHFRAVGERLHQGIVQWVLLARAMRERLASVPAIMTNRVTVNRDELFYSGNSQGGIFGGTFMAVSPDVLRGHLGVPGNNYSLLLHRSTDFTGYFTILRGVYRMPIEQSVVLAYTQLHWDGTDPVSYLRHIAAEPFSGNAPHGVIVGPAKGDYQVSVMTNEIAARSDIGIPLLANYDRTRTPWGCPPAAYPRRGSGVVLYDFGNPWPAPGNRPPAHEMVGDPHERPRRSEVHQRQIATFFRTGEIVDVCGGDGCRPD